jgi:mono/diheme cytochrome c family protein
MTLTAQQTIPPTTSRWPRRMLVALVGALFLAGAVVSHFGIQHPPLSGPGTPPQAVTPADLVVQIDLPHEDFTVPPGPHRERFQVNCTICHSPRLAFTQPPLPEKKWQEVVHKMVAVYGAPPTPDEEREIVRYLSAVHGQPPP